MFYLYFWNKTGEKLLTAKKFTLGEILIKMKQKFSQVFK